MDERKFILTFVAAALVAVLAVCTVVWHNIDVQGRVQTTCIGAGGQWQNSTCVRTGR